MRCRLSLLLSAATAIVSISASSDVTNDAPYSYAGDIPPLAHQLDETYTFEHYLSHFSKTYTDRDEYDRRSAIFSRNLEKILTHNEGRLTPDGEIIGGGYVMGINQFTDVEQDELPMGYNKLLHPMWSTQLKGGASKVQRRLGEGEGEDGSDTYYGTTSYSKPPAFDMTPIDQLPESVNWVEKNKVNPQVPNQGGCGSCWSFASTAVIESHFAIANNDDNKPFISLSEQNMLQCTPNPDNCGGQGGCSGATVELALNYIADITTKKTGGMFTVADVPYSASPRGTCDAVTQGKNPTVGISGWTQMPVNNLEATMNALVKAGPLAIAVAASGWGMYEKGVWGGGDATINHAVLLAGYGVDEKTGEKYWLVRNSWGSSFGEKGYIRIKRSDDDDTNCQQDNDPLVGIACALDDNGNKIDVQPATICGTGGVLFDVAYPTDPHKIEG